MTEKRYPEEAAEEAVATAFRAVFSEIEKGCPLAAAELGERMGSLIREMCVHDVTAEIAKLRKALEEIRYTKTFGSVGSYIIGFNEGVRKCATIATKALEETGN